MSKPFELKGTSIGLIARAAEAYGWRVTYKYLGSGQEMHILVHPESGTMMGVGYYASFATRIRVHLDNKETTTTDPSAQLIERILSQRRTDPLN